MTQHIVSSNMHHSHEASPAPPPHCLNSISEATGEQFASGDDIQLECSCDAMFARTVGLMNLSNYFAYLLMLES